MVSEEDKRIAQDLVPGLRATVVPNCIDINDYDLAQENEGISHDLLFVGKMDYRPNVDAVLWFAKEIWPELRQSRPSITWAIVGKNPHPRLRSLQELDGIRLTGRVERIQPYLKGAKVVILPFRVGSGTRLKFIEAIASGKAIVGTNVGVEGFNVIDGQELLIADRPADFIRAVLLLLDDSNRRALLGAAGKEKAKEYDWRKVIPIFDQVYENLLAPEIS
jgi:glycosyltransferase involved in cell wall biosynthesis